MRNEKRKNLMKPGTTPYLSRLFTIIFLLLLLLPSCQIYKPNVIEEQYLGQYPGISMNKELLLTLPSFNPEPRLSSHIFVEVRNLSKKIIIFPSDYNIELYFDNKGEWAEIKNNIYYNLPPGYEIIYLMPKGTKYKDFEYIAIKPQVKIEGDSVVIRVVVVGEVFEKNSPTGEMVGAYKDITILP